jgi:Glycosyl hydrolase family 9/Cellulase N-terminal ig-like domain
MSKYTEDADMKNQFKRVWNKKKIYASLILMNIILMGSIVTYKILYEDPVILLNQEGFTPNGAKTLLIKSDYIYHHGTYNIVNKNGTVAKENLELNYLGQLWGSHYYEGDFSDFILPGNYSIHVKIDLIDISSEIFEISNSIYDLSLERAFEFFYYQRSNTVVYELIPGYAGHGLDHMDDGTIIDGEFHDLLGGWSSAGDFHKHTYWGAHIFGVIYGCLYAYEMRPDLYNTIDNYYTDGKLGNNSIPDILDEAMWGIQYARKLMLPNGTILGSVVEDEMKFAPAEKDTDNIVGTEDDRYLSPDHAVSDPYECMWLAAGFAKFSNIINSTGYFNKNLTDFTQFAKNIYNNYSSSYNTSASLWYSPAAAPFLAVNQDLFKLEGTQIYCDNAKWAAQAISNYTMTYSFDTQKTTGNDIGIMDRGVGMVLDWAIDRNTPESWILAKQLAKFRWENIWSHAFNDTSNFYNLLKLYNTDVEPDRWTYFKDNLGLNSFYLYSIYALTLSNYVTNGTYSGMQKILTSLTDWMYGKNPDGICMIEGVGDKNLPNYHHRYRFEENNPRGATPGAVPNGYIERDNKPYLDLEEPEMGGAVVQNIDFDSNEPWLPHNIAFLMAISTLSIYS